MKQGIGTIIYPVKDLPSAKALFTSLSGVEPYVDQPYYVGYRVGDQEIGLDPNGHKQGMTAPFAYWHVDDIRKCLQTIVDAGATVQQDVRDVGGGKLVATASDADGNVIGLLQEA